MGRTRFTVNFSVFKCGRRVLSCVGLCGVATVSAVVHAVGAVGKGSVVSVGVGVEIVHFSFPLFFFCGGFRSLYFFGVAFNG